MNGRGDDATRREPVRSPAHPAHSGGASPTGPVPGPMTIVEAPPDPGPSAKTAPRQSPTSRQSATAEQSLTLEQDLTPEPSPTPSHLPNVEEPGTDRDSAAGSEPDIDPGPLLRIVRRQELAFAVVGGFNTLLGIVLTLAWLAVLGDGVPPSVAVVAAYGISVVVAFVLHRTLVFRVRGHLLRDFVAFVAVNSGGLLMNVVLLELAVTVLGFPEAPAAIVVMGFVAVVSFFGHRHISFRRRVG
ncbi:GtrA family protein [Nocardia cyriacigeorgica]|uniref:GtrA family protein n=1 Tax=Nocardia cyriacigeorgica TaxID=135487 RepID=UPI0024568CA3|nr:GtrA family protein [Nocardia cyriacigeorgica]